MLCIIIQIVLPSTVVAYGEENRIAESEPSVLSISTLSQQYGLTIADITLELNKGYSIYQIQSALQQQDVSGISYHTVLDSIAPNVMKDLNKLENSILETEKYQSDANAPRPNVPSLKDVLGSSVTQSVYSQDQIESVTKGVYWQDESVSNNVYTSILADRPTTYDETVLKRMEVNTDKAPFSIQNSGESISTMSRDLTLKSQDMVLPGRNGQSFALTRKYDSSQSQFYEKNVTKVPVYTMAFLPKFYADVFYYPYGTQRAPGGQFYMIDEFNFNYFGSIQQRYVGQSYPGDIEWTRFYYLYSQGVIEEEKKKWETGDYKYRNPNTESPKIDYFFSLVTYTGIQVGFDGKMFPTGEVFLQGADYEGDTVRNSVNNSKITPLGKGWDWDIPAIQTKYNSTYLRLQGGASYEIDSNNKLVGYPWKDIELKSDTSKTVFSRTSSRVLTFLEGTKQYFSSDGKLILITDAYGNETKFEYVNQAPYGDVLKRVTDALNNEIKIDYSATEVVVTKGSEVVRYQKQLAPGTDKEILASVKDQMNRTTSYTYEVKQGSFNLLPNYYEPENNYYALLTNVSYPTGANTAYVYEKGNRTIGKQSESEEFFQVKSREDVVHYVNGTNEIKNHVEYSGGDSSYGYSTSFQTTSNTGLTNTTYTFKKQYIDEKTPANYYNTLIEQQAVGLTEKKTILQTFDEEIRKLPVPGEIKTISSINGVDSTPLIINKTYDDFGNVLTEKNSMYANVVTQHNYDPSSHLLINTTQPIDELQQNYTEIQRYSQGTIKQIIVRKGNSSGELKSQMNYTYDSHGNMSQMVIKDDQKDMILYQQTLDPVSGRYEVIQTVNVKDADDNLSTITTRAQYESLTGLLKTFTDGNGKDTKYEHDLLGRVTKEIYPDQNKREIQYDDQNNKLTVTDPDDIRTVREYNELGEKEIETIGTLSSTYKYDAYGRLAESFDALHQKTSNLYDSWNRVKRITYADNYYDRFEYDDVNRTKLSIDAENNQTRESYDLLGRLSKTERVETTKTSLLTTNTYNYVDKLTSLKDGNGYITNYGYDVLGRLLTVQDPKQNVTSYQYSMSGKLNEIQYADGKKIKKQYDEIGRLIKQTDPSQLFSKYYYDNNGNLLRQVDRKGIETNNAYNSRNFLMQKITPHEVVSFTYNNAGKRLTMNDLTGLTKYKYDILNGKLSEVTYPDLRSIKYTYDGQGRREQMIDPFGNTIRYGYDTRNRLKWVGNSSNDFDASYVYKNNGLLSNSENKIGITTTRTYDGVDLTGLTAKTDGNLQFYSFGYSYDLNHNQVNKTEKGTQYTFTYDELNRISTSDQFNEAYDYDKIGNRFLKQSDDFLPVAPISYEYDDRNRLVKATNEAGQPIEYKYNGDGLLVERTENNNTTRYYYDDDKMIAEANVSAGAVSLKASYTRGNELVSRTDANGSKAYYGYNGHGDVVELRDSSYTLLNSYSYDIWGNPIYTKENIKQPFRYSGEFWDGSTELQYLRARWYDPKVGRFINEDTFEGKFNEPLSLNLYTYVQNNPLTRTDPTGHSYDWSLNLISKGYNKGSYNAANASTLILGANGLSAAIPALPELGEEEANYRLLYVPFHEIAQIQAAKAIYDKYGGSPTLEKKLSKPSGKGNYKADIVFGNKVWEVKPLNGEDPKPQLELYKKAGNLIEGDILSPINGIPVFENVKMNITFPAEGEIRYSLYNQNNDGTIRALETTGAAFIIARALLKMTPWGGKLSPGY